MSGPIGDVSLGVRLSVGASGGVLLAYGYSEIHPFEGGPAASSPRKAVKRDGDTL